MRIVATLKNKDEIALLSKIGADVFLLETDQFTRAAETPFSLEAIKEIVKAIHRRRKKAYVLLNTLIHEADIFVLDEYLKELRRIKVDGIVCYDLTVILAAAKQKLEKLCIYQPGTMSTHPKNLAFYEQLGIKGVTISREITLEEIKSFFTEETKVEFSLVGHGYQEMFYSQRKLVSSYLNHQGLPHDKLSGSDLSIREKQRLDQFFPIVEDRFGTQIFRAKKLASFEFVSSLESKLQDFFIERRFIGDQEYFESIKAYKQGDFRTFVDEYGKEYDTGFYLLPTERLKGDVS